MGLNAAGLNFMLTALAAEIDYVSLHTDTVGSGSGNEVTGGTPAYTRENITWNTAAGGNLDSSNQPVFDVPGSTTVARLGFWNAVTAGTFYGDAELTDEAYGSQGTYTLTDCDITVT